ncbi:hypothetical protein LXA43DRAFT_1094606 [Ganoderma leucocontextum]|nr:hypothetical protein LXA43DRAFT_1094606 [Ganoderma leucocontextum]
MLASVFASSNCPKDAFRGGRQWSPPPSAVTTRPGRTRNAAHEPRPSASRPTGCTAIAILVVGGALRQFSPARQTRALLRTWETEGLSRCRRVSTRAWNTIADRKTMDSIRTQNVQQIIDNDDRLSLPLSPGMTIGESFERNL